MTTDVKLMYLYISDWTGFVLSTIQLWENLYIQWIEKGMRLMLVPYENLTNNLKLKTLKDICHFLNFKLDKVRLRCVLAHKEDRFERKNKCIKDNQSQTNSQQKKNVTKNENIFTRSHRIWINSAIRKVYRASSKRGLATFSLSNYEDTIIKIPSCHENILT